MLVKRYDHRCDYQEGERVYVENRYGKSLATVLKVIRLPGQSCDKAILEFEDPGFRAKWEQERATPYFAVNSGRGTAILTYVEVGDSEPISIVVSPGDHEPHSQAIYRDIVLTLLRQQRTVSLETIQSTVRGSGVLGPRDLAAHPSKPRKVFWMVRVQEAIKNLKDNGRLRICGRELYREAGA
jgi:hypothetical protein